MNPRRHPATILAIVPAVALMLVATAATALASQRPDDGTVTFWVLEALRNDPRVDEATIMVDTDQGVVTLTGTTTDLAERRFAEREAEKIAGVRAVVDELKVDTPPRPDDQIQQDVRHRLDTDPELHDAGQVNIAVTGGVATLTGTVHSWSEAEEATLAASDVRGVTHIDNRLETEPQPRRDDADILHDVQGRLDRDVYLADLPVAVAVHQGAVVLTGDVGNAYEKTRAGDEVRWIPGVRDVRNELQVVQWDEQGTRAAPPAPSDGELLSSVTAALDQDQRLDADDVTVEVRGGIVTLLGEVPTAHQREVAGADARDVVGTVWVTNELTVAPLAASDELTRTEIQDGLTGDYALGDHDVGVKVDGGVVTLTGDVDNLWLKAHAAEVARRSAGVVAVVNEIDVHRGPHPSDHDLQKRIVARLEHNAETAPVAHRIEVQVQKGKAVLSGKVDSWAERDAADRLAFLTSGVWAVDSHLQVAGVDEDWEAIATHWPVDYDPGLHYPDFAMDYFYSLR